MSKCAFGSVDHKLDVAITDFDDQNVAKSILIGDETELQRRVKFIDMATEVKIGEYFVENSFFWGEFIGAAMMSGAERQLSQGFAANLCEEVFGIKLTSEELLSALITS